MINLGLVAAIITVFCFTFGDVIAKRVSVDLGNRRTALYIVGAGVIPLIAAFIVLQPQFTITIALISVAGGFFLAAGYPLVYKSLETEQATNTWVLLNLPAAVVVLIGIFALKEQISVIESFAVIAIFFGVLLVTVTKKMEFNSKLLPAVAGNLCWATFFAIMIFEINSYNASPVGIFFLARGFGFLWLLAYYKLFTKKTEKKDRVKEKAVKMSNKLLGVVSGIFDGVGQTAFAFIIFYNFVALGGAITATEPALVLILSYFVYKERVTIMQFIGLMVSVIGAVALSVL